VKKLISRHAKTAKGFRSGRDVIRANIRAKDAKITELTYRIKTLEAEVKAETTVSRRLRWEVGTESYLLRHFFNTSTHACNGIYQNLVLAKPITMQDQGISVWFSTPALRTVARVTHGVGMMVLELPNR
jgi:hypothetical protein